MYVEMALDALKAKDAKVIVAELKEFTEASPAESLRTAELFRMTDLQKGYQVGLETARAMLSDMQAAVEAGVSI